MLGFEKTITIYNQHNPAPKETNWPKTVIDGASWAGHQRVTIGEGLTANDGYSVRVPLAAMPVGFVGRSEWEAMTDPTGHWTAQAGDIVVLGAGPDVTDGNIAAVTKRFTDCFVVTAVYTANMGRLLPHLRLEGK